MSKFRRNSAAVKLLLLTKAGNKCSFPGCNIELIDSTGMPIAEVCHIEAISPGGPRYNPSHTSLDSATRQVEEMAELDNFIVLCPTHHRLIDAHPVDYSVEWLKTVREQHENAIIGSQSKKPDLASLGRKLTNFHDCLDTWKVNTTNGDEEFWHGLFKDNPKIIAQSTPNCIIQITDKSYIGGKGISNSGGKIVDFIYATKLTKNTVVVEIKTPTTKLIGREYRSDIFSISEELNGAIIQVLTYRNHLIKHFHSLRGAEQSLSFEAYDPMCIVVAGNLEHERLSAPQRASFDLFRANIDVTVITYDELFAKIQDLVDMLDDAAIKQP